MKNLSKNDNNSCKSIFRTSQILRCTRADHQALAISRNACGHCGKSRPLKNQSECAKYLCHIISIVIIGNPSRGWVYLLKD